VVVTLVSRIVIPKESGLVRRRNMDGDRMGGSCGREGTVMVMDGMRNSVPPSPACATSIGREYAKGWEPVARGCGLGLWCYGGTHELGPDGCSPGGSFYVLCLRAEGCPGRR